MDKALYAELLTKRLAELEGETARVRAELSGIERDRDAEAAAQLALRDGRNSPNYMAPSAERELRRAEESSLYVTPHISTSPPAAEVVQAKRLGEAQKREFLEARGWTVHKDIEDQSIRICWENGARWYSLEDAFDVELKALARKRLVDDGWSVLTDPVDEHESWCRPGTTDCVTFPVACAELGMPLADVHSDWLS
jgi:hypothetical protein